MPSQVLYHADARGHFFALTGVSVPFGHCLIQMVHDADTNQLIENETATILELSLLQTLTVVKK